MSVFAQALANVRALRRRLYGLVALVAVAGAVCLGALGIAVSRADIEKAYGEADPAAVEALKFARDRIRSHHERQMP